MGRVSLNACSQPRTGKLTLIMTTRIALLFLVFLLYQALCRRPLLIQTFQQLLEMRKRRLREPKDISLYTAADAGWSATDLVSLSLTQD